MSARYAGVLLLVLLLAPAAEAGWFSGSKKKLPQPIKLAEIRRHDAARLNKPSKVSSKSFSPSWGAQGEVFYQPRRMKIPHQQEF